MELPEVVDVLVVGAGPAGSSAACWLAGHGHRVAIVERKAFPRDKTCGDVLTPRAVQQLADLGLGVQVAAGHRIDGLRVKAHGRRVELDWPDHPAFGPHGYALARRNLDTMLADRAVAAGALLVTGAEAVAPIIDRGFVRGAVVRDTSTDVRAEIRARYVVVADGANSRFGRLLGTTRTREWPYGTGIRGYWASPRHGEHRITSVLDLTDEHGRAVPGYGWVFPLGDGTVNVGVGLVSTFRGFKDVNTTHLLNAFIDSARQEWGLAQEPTHEPTAGRLPMGGSVGPRSGPTYLVVGDAAGMVNPFNGEGIETACITGRMAADLIHQALALDDPRALAMYSRRIDDEYGLSFKMARLFAQAMGQPGIMLRLTQVGVRSRSLMEWSLRIMANLLRPDEIGPAELAYRAMARVVRLIPEP